MIVPGINPVESLEEEFFILSKNPPEIEALQEAQEGMLPKQNVEYGTLGGGCFVKKSRLDFYIAMFVLNFEYKTRFKVGDLCEDAEECVQAGSVREASRGVHGGEGSV